MNISIQSPINWCLAYLKTDQGAYKFLINVFYHVKVNIYNT